MLLSELAKSEFGKALNWTGLGVHFDRNTSTEALKDKGKLNFFQLLNFLA